MKIRINEFEVVYKIIYWFKPICNLFLFFLSFYFFFFIFFPPYFFFNIFRKPNIALGFLESFKGKENKKDNYRGEKGIIEIYKIFPLGMY